jgi:hypothetical protein
VFEKLKVDYIRHVTLRGTWSGAWLASLFVWLRPNEVKAVVGGNQIYPGLVQGYGTDVLPRKLSVRLEDTSSTLHDRSWHVTTWREAGDSVPVKFDLRDEFSLGQHTTPLKSARYQLLNTGSVPAVEATERLAGSLVILAVEVGHLWNENGTAIKPLLALCSHGFLQIYNTVMGRFGWELTRDSTFAANTDATSQGRQGRMDS